MAPLAELKGEDRAPRESQPRLLCLTLLNPRTPSSTSNKLLGRRPRSTDYRIREIVIEKELKQEPVERPKQLMDRKIRFSVGAPLPLDGTDLKLISVKINGNELKEGDYHVDARHLVVKTTSKREFHLGNRKSSDNFCTQCEAEGFCNITFYQGDKHFAFWEDHFKKPCYLFALVAGQLESRDDTFTTCSGRKVALRIWTPPQDIPKTEHAMYSLKALYESHN
ncbi:hypothetical protein LXL04_036341 [Taraxacum kok-saghyz]